MKQCPKCQAQYADVTLRFCTDDGTPLVDADPSDLPTVVLEDAPTITSVRPPDRYETRRDLGMAEPDRRTEAAAAGRGSKTAIAVILTALGMLLLFGIAGVGAWLYMRSQQANVSVNSSNVSNPENRKTAVPDPTPTANRAAPTPTRPPVDPAADPIDEAEIRSDVMDRLDEWNDLIEEKDLPGLRAVYADTLDQYYTGRNVSAAAVVADKMRAFRDYDLITIDLNVQDVNLDAAGNSAAIELVKTWTFTGAKPFCGTIRSRMEMRRINGEWRITGERDVPGTFRRTC